MSAATVERRSVGVEEQLKPLTGAIATEAVKAGSQKEARVHRKCYDARIMLQRGEKVRARGRRCRSQVRLNKGQLCDMF